MSIKKLNVKQALPYIFLIGGAIGVYCAFVLSQDKIKLLENPHLHLGCSLDPIIACGSVISSAQGHAFGFPNPFLGLAGFGGVMAIGLALMAGARFKRWFWLMIEGGMLFAILFIHWLFFQTVYSIGALCLYCIAVWIVTITSFWYVTLYNIDEGHLRLPKAASKVYPWIRRRHLDILVLWLLILAALVLQHFWYYYGRYF